MQVPCLHNQHIEVLDVINRAVNFYKTSSKDFFVFARDYVEKKNSVHGNGLLQKAMRHLRSTE